MTNLKALAIGTIAALGIGATVLFAEESTSYRSGPPMMGGPGMGAGMMGYGMGFVGPRTLAALDVSEAQRKQIVSVQDEARKKNWTAMGAMQDEMVKVRDAFWVGEKRDRAAILAGNKRMFEIRQQMLENSLDAADRIEQILTPQQRAQLKKQSGPGWMMDPDE